MATSVGGVLTGRGADFIILDDPLKPTDALSEAGRTAVNDWYNNTLLSRLNDKRKGCIIILIQRLHQELAMCWRRTIGPCCRSPRSRKGPRAFFSSPPLAAIALCASSAKRFTPRETNEDELLMAPLPPVAMRFLVTVAAACETPY